ncbi:hypothetical protein [Malonomonas rubra]|uniref:hypothetical protein n=1 Tax=Malonomonas rubra TaxID=57040 RepID=UPI0014288CB6|nr:hypothetical protein [Malonomonas rubra]
MQIRSTPPSAKQRSKETLSSTTFTGRHGKAVKIPEMVYSSTNQGPLIKVSLKAEVDMNFPAKQKKGNLQQKNNYLDKTLRKVKKIYRHETFLLPININIDIFYHVRYTELSIKPFSIFVRHTKYHGIRYWQKNKGVAQGKETYLAGRCDRNRLLSRADFAD